jgi:hypothetical protein
VAITLTFLRGYPDQGAYQHVFGYYFDHDLSTFVPVFRDGDANGTSGGDCPAGGTLSVVNDTIDFVMQKDAHTTVGFAICSGFQGEPQGWVATEANLSRTLNPVVNRVAIFNVAPSIHILSFEENTDNSYYASPGRTYNTTDFMVKLESSSLGGQKFDAAVPVQILDF